MPVLMSMSRLTLPLSKVHFPLLRRLVLFVGLIYVGLFFGLSQAQAQIALVEGRNYIKLKKPQLTDGRKIEVIEFFWYNCPHCFTFEPTLEAWVKRQPADVSFKRIPVRFRDSFEPQQKAYFALQLMGVSESLQSKIFDHIHIKRNNLDSAEALTNFVVSQGVDKTEFLRLFNSFSVVSLARGVTKMQADFQIDGVPTLAIAGKYLTSPALTQSSEAALQVASVLIQKERSERAQRVTPKPATRK